MISGGNHSILDRAGRGEIFAETYAAIPGQKLMVNVVAAEEARILFLDVGRILKVCSNSCVFHHTLIENLLSFRREESPSVETDFSYFIKIDPGKTAVVFVLSGYGKRKERI